MNQAVCPFCNIRPDRVFYEGRLVAAIWDGFPLSPGHALLVPRRHVATFFEATREERIALVDAIEIAQQEILKEHHPDGFNIGINVGEAAGQTVFHLHVHVIPRYLGDVADPRGGVRHVIPSRGNYLVWDETVARNIGNAPHNRALVTGAEDPLLPHLVAHIATARQLDMAVAFVLEKGVIALEDHLRDLLRRKGQIRFLTGDYLDVTEPQALRRILDLEGSIQCRFVEVSALARSGAASFHPKAYIFMHDMGGVAYIGSSNLTEVALSNGLEWNYRVVSSRDVLGFQDVLHEFEKLFGHPAARNLDHALLDSYQSRRRVAVLPAGGRVVAPEPVQPPEPHSIQQEALEALKKTREIGNGAGLVVMATGLGKTWLAAFDSNCPEYSRVLFVAHREEILDQAMKIFRRGRPDSHLGHYSGLAKDSAADVLFASIQTLGRTEHLERFGPNSFDYIVMDEFHHAYAQTYRRVIGYFRPKFLLGLTATPERTDGGDLLELCQENLVYRADLGEGIRSGLLCPFHYYGVPDEVDYSNIPWRNSRFDEEALTKAVATVKRATNAFEQYQKRAKERTLAFCVSQRHADFMAEFFQERGIQAVAVHSGKTSAPRALSLQRLMEGSLKVVFAVDIFNEGVDLPDLDTVMMLRPTESRIVWLQQFG